MSPDVPRTVTSTPPSVVELRQYTVIPGRRDFLAELFLREFLDPQEAVGARIAGPFYDLEKPDRFVWLRAFSDLASRPSVLASFYASPAWKTHRDAVNGVLIDSNNVLLLRPVRDDPDSSPGQEWLGEPGPPSVLLGAIFSFKSAPTQAFFEFFELHVQPALAETLGTRPVGLETESASNNYPNLPVREGDHFFVWLAWHSNRSALEKTAAVLEHGGLPPPLQAELDSWLRGPPECLRLVPARRFVLPGASSAPFSGYRS